MLSLSVVVCIVRAMWLSMLLDTVSTSGECGRQLVITLCFFVHVLGFIYLMLLSINKSFLRARYHSLLSPSLCRTVYVLLELLFVTFG